MTAETRNRWLIRAGYVALAGVSFGYFFFLGFPYERLLTRSGIDESKMNFIARGVAGFEKSSGMKLDIGRIQPGLLFSVKLRDVKLTPQKRGFAGPNDPPADPVLQVEEVRLTPKILPLLTGKLGLGVSGSVYGGRVSGKIAKGRKSTAVDLDVTNVEIAKYPMLANRFQLNVAGLVSGNVDLALDDEDGTKSTGKIDIQVKNPIINESNPYNIQKIPSTGFDKGGALIVLKDGKATLQEVGLRGNDLDVVLDGEIVLRKKIASSTWNGKVAIKMSDGFKSAVPMLEPFLMAGKGGDGVYRYKLTGLLGSPKPSPDRGR